MGRVGEDSFVEGGDESMFISPSQLKPEYGFGYQYPQQGSFGNLEFMGYPQYPPFIPYPPYFPLFNPYPMYPPQQYPQSSSITMGTQNPIEGVMREQIPSPPLAIPTVPTQEARTSRQGKANMIDYSKLDAPKYKEGDVPFKYVKAIKMIANKLDASDSRAI
ncbi:hypothetical protein P3X46_000805 [Hevea brasiliensis]|uniref:Uncharacterized protein n=1 Tax=Hevea brasiliensis TaxID=3981 RepID=A0ABQ9NCL2_HEVBR|nr:hypothetical protein P3X46_000805 [Hevea brasiliensis]